MYKYIKTKQWACWLNTVKMVNENKFHSSSLSLNPSISTGSSDNWPSRKQGGVLFGQQ